MAQSQSHVFHIQDGKLWAWSLPKMTVVIQGVSIPALKQQADFRSLDVSADGWMISFINGRGEFVVVDVKRKTTEVHVPKSPVDGDWWAAYSVKRANEKGISKVLLMKSRVYQGYGL
jgi:hypothetical protein